MVVRQARDGEEAKLALLHNVGNAHYISTLRPHYGWRNIGPEDVQKWREDPRSDVLVLTINDEIVGYAQTLESLEKGTHDLKVLWLAPSTYWDFAQSNIVVHPDYRGSGLGKELLRAVIAKAEASNAKYILALSFSDNEAAEGLLHSLGFQCHDVLMDPRFSSTRPFQNSSVYAALDLDGYSRPEKCNKDLLIRGGNPDDAEALARIHQANVWWDEKSWTVDWSRQYVSGTFGHRVIVGELDGQVVGAMDYFDRGTIGISGVLPEFQNRGIGSDILAELLHQMKMRGIRTALADSGLTQKEAISMYHRFGFTIERRQNLWALPLEEG
jgi:ribosomal protein S18 acetylase RimI-like enzyme